MTSSGGYCEEVHGDLQDRRIVWIFRLKKLILPPASPLVAAFVGLLLYATGLERSGLILIATGLLALYLVSAPWFGRRLLRSLDREHPLDPASSEARNAGAIVILDAGRHSTPQERGGASVSSHTLERLTAGAELYRHLQLPILVSGDGARDLMAQVLDRSFGVPVHWIERTSRNTHENAVCSASMLRAVGIHRVVLVTHFWHIPRAQAAFRRAGIQVVPAPMGFIGQLRSENGLIALVPNARVLFLSYLALHEWIGIVWYRIRYRHGSLAQS